MLTENAIKRLIEPEEVASLAGWLVVRPGRHGHGGVVHDGRRVDGPMSALSHGRCRRRRRRPPRRRLGVRRVGGCRAGGAADPRGDGIPPVLAVRRGAAAGVRVIAPDLRGRGRSNGLDGPAGLRAARARSGRGARCARRRARRRRRALDGRVRRLRARRPVPRAGLARRARRRRAAARSARGAVLRRDHRAGPRTDRRAARDAIRSRSTPTSTSGARIRRSGGTGRPSSRRTSPTTSSATEPELRPATSYATLEEDSIDQNTGTAIADALARLRNPTVLLTAERGLLDQVPALYAPERLPGLLAAYPGLAARVRRRT